MKHKIVFLDEYSLGGVDIEQIRSLGDYTGYYNTLPSETISHAIDAEIVISNKVMISCDVMEALPKLRMIAIAATGMNNVDLDAAHERGIVVRNAVGYSTYSVAEATLSMALSLLRETAYYDRFFKSGGYSSSPTIFHLARPIRQLRGHNWGIIGLGNIGREVARLAEAFGCNVAYYSTSGTNRVEKYERMELDALLKWADVISIHSPLNDATRNLIGAKEIAMMRQTAVLINVARGGIVDEVALAEALNNRVIAGAALDVFSSEPLRQSPLYSITEPDMLLASPHTAWASQEAIARLVEAIAANIAEYIASTEK